ELSAPGRHLRDGVGPEGGGGRRAAHPRGRGSARRRRLGHADDPLGQHSRADRHDRGVRITADNGWLSGSLKCPSLVVKLPNPAGSATTSILARLPLLSNCKPSMENFLPFPIGPRLEQMDFEPIPRGPFSASPTQNDASAISRGPAIVSDLS